MKLSLKIKISTRTERHDMLGILKKFWHGSRKYRKYKAFKSTIIRKLQMCECV